MTGAGPRLAVLGAEPAFASPVVVGRPNLADRERVLTRIGRVLDSGRLSNDGPCVRELEERVADYLGVRHCLATSNGTAALSLAVRALALEGEVIVPSWTFVATAHALLWEGLTPVFADVDPSTHNIDPAAIESLVTTRTSAIVGVHLWGRPCAIEQLEELGARLGLRVLYDSAHAFGCSHGGRMVGGFGSAETLSFHATKFFHTLEGGAVTTDDDEIASRVRAIRNFGLDSTEHVASLGINAKLNEVSAAVGLSLLDDVDVLVEANRSRHELYGRELDGVAGLRLLGFEPEERSNFQYVVVEIDESVAAIDRDELLATLGAENVVARRYFYPGCHRLEPYATQDPDAGSRLPHTETLARRALCLPTGRAVSSSDVRTICSIVRNALSSREVGARIGRALGRLSSV